MINLQNLRQIWYNKKNTNKNYCMEQLFPQHILNKTENKDEIQLFLDTFKQKTLLHLWNMDFSFYFVPWHWNIIERGKDGSSWRFLIKSKSEKTQTETFYIFDILFKEKFIQNYDITETSRDWRDLDVIYSVEKIKIDKVYKPNSQKNWIFEEITPNFNKIINQKEKKEKITSFFHHLLKQIDLWLIKNIKRVENKK